MYHFLGCVYKDSVESVRRHILGGLSGHEGLPSGVIHFQGYQFVSLDGKRRRWGLFPQVQESGPGLQQARQYICRRCRQCLVMIPLNDRFVTHRTRRSRRTAQWTMRTSSSEVATISRLLTLHLYCIPKARSMKPMFARVETYYVVRVIHRQSTNHTLFCIICQCTVLDLHARRQHKHCAQRVSANGWYGRCRRRLNGKGRRVYMVYMVHRRFE